MRVWKNGLYSVSYRGNALQFSANGTRIKEGYRFKEPGRKLVKAWRGNAKISYTITVRKR